MKLRNTPVQQTEKAPEYSIQAIQMGSGHLKMIVWSERWSLVRARIHKSMGIL